MHTEKLSLLSASLVNLNIMLGAGVFVNTVLLATYGGSLGFLAYAAIGLLMTPLIFSAAKMLAKHPHGGFFTFGNAEINKLVGFISAWGYFTGKLASGALMIHVSMSLLQTIVPVLAQVNVFFLDAVSIIAFTLLNLKNIKFGRNVQFVFLAVKFLPILFVVLIGLFVFSWDNIVQTVPHKINLLNIIPVTIYAFSGFEGAISLSRCIENAKKNAPRAVIISYTFVVFICSLFQFCLSGELGNLLISAKSYLDVVPLLVTKLLGYSTGSTILELILNTAIATSALGGAYSILYSNNWNLLTLAENSCIPLKKWFCYLNRQGIPALCVLAEAAICASYIILTRGDQLTLQKIAVIGCMTAYSITTLSALVSEIRQKRLLGIALAGLGIVACALMLTPSLLGLDRSGRVAIATAILVIVAGIGLFNIAARTKIRTTNNQ